MTLARAASDTLAGIRSIDTPAFIVAQLVGTLVAAALFGWLLRGKVVPPVLMPITNNENTISSPYG
ncbi:hypothetical protein [Chitinimonas naiadis]